ncbi:hypothetical protein [Halorarum salinum]|uniref:Uncharacterized protein n=1 Tax=Halorarum salinum TaxID=2743089 RepID=A0A7D5QB73_9EURY|nr:hypothetical protein [Halobaculum salinum]QLG62937.1 hypothetical protein HUG12_14840 [Halobaculum salinum]
MAGDTAPTAPDGDGGGPEADPRPGRIGIALGLVLAGTALCVGVVWIARLATGGPAVADGLLFDLLPPALLVYLGARHLGTVRRRLRADRTGEGDGGDV